MNRRERLGQEAMTRGKTKKVRFNCGAPAAEHFADRLQDGQYAFHEGLPYQVIDYRILGGTHVEFILRPVANL